MELTRLQPFFITVFYALGMGLHAVVDQVVFDGLNAPVRAPDIVSFTTLVLTGAVLGYTLITLVGAYLNGSDICIMKKTRPLVLYALAFFAVICVYATTGANVICTLSAGLGLAVVAVRDALARKKTGADAWEPRSMTLSSVLSVACIAACMPDDSSGQGILSELDASSAASFGWLAIAPCATVVVLSGLRTIEPDCSLLMSSFFAGIPAAWALSIVMHGWIVSTFNELAPFDGIQNSTVAILVAPVTALLSAISIISAMQGRRVDIVLVVLSMVCVARAAGRAGFSNRLGLAMATQTGIIIWILYSARFEPPTIIPACMKPVASKESTSAVVVYEPFGDQAETASAQLDTIHEDAPNTAP